MPICKYPVRARARGRHECLLNGGEQICSLCCAKIRCEETCPDCRHFVATRHHETKKLKKRKDLPFLFELNSDLEAAIDQALIKLENGKMEEATSQIDGLLEEHPHYPTVQYAKGCLCTQ